MILDDARPAGRALTFLDIGCGQGFDGDGELQRSVADIATGGFVGVEPDPEIEPASQFSEVHACPLEVAPIEPGSIDAAYAIMVLEHLADPAPFYDAVWSALREGGVFWALTVDRRHWFCRCSRAFDLLHIKEIYLRLLLGRPGVDRYSNYPVFYRSNTPHAIGVCTKRFRQVEFMNFSRVGQVAAYLPAFLRPLAAALDAWAIRRGQPGTLLAVRLQK